MGFEGTWKELSSFLALQGCKVQHSNISLILVNHLNAQLSESIYASPKRATTSKDLQVGRFQCNKPVIGVHHGLWPKEQSHAMHPWSPLSPIAHHQQQAEWGPSVSPTVKGLAVRSFPSPISISSQILVFCAWEFCNFRGEFIKESSYSHWFKMVLYVHFSFS